ncbi:MAG: bifunctional glycosyltransferase family 2/GtrA family protein [Bryobacterales bacterium]|nr:bifunctional glycosyltransferase family 2/GtrA family protein [Bryobacterales bacterium]
MSSAVVLIPAYKPGAEMTRLVSGLLERAGELLAGIVVVDDGSGSAYRPLFDAVAGHRAVNVLRHAVNLGKGAALKTGFNHALLAWPEAAGVVTADADGQHNVEDILNVARYLTAHPGEIVLGVRGFEGHIPLRSRVGNLLTRYVFRVFTGLRLSDTQTGLRGWPAGYCMAVLPIAINGYDFELECLMDTRENHGFKVTELPIKTIYLDGNKSSHFNPVRDSLRIYFVFARYCGASLAAAVIDSLFFYIAFHLSAGLALSQVVGRLAALVIAFTLQRNLVFRSDASAARSLVKYLALLVVMGVVSYSMMNFLYQRAQFPVLAAKMTAEGILFLVNFSILRQFIFTRSKTANGSL